MDSLAHDEPTQRVEPGAAPHRDEPHPSRPVRSGTLVAPPPPGLVALPTDLDAPWRRPDETPVSRRAATSDTAPQPQAAEQQPPVVEQQPPVVEQQPPVVEQQPVVEQPADVHHPAASAAAPQNPVSPDAVPNPAATHADEPTRADPPAQAPEPVPAADGAHPAWLGEPTGRFDLDLPEHGRTNPSWLGEPTRRPDPDVPFDQYALPDDPPSAAFGRAREAVTIDLAEDDWHADVPDAAGWPAPGSPVPGSSMPAIPAPPGVHRPVAAGTAQPQAAAYAAPAETFTMPVQEVPRESWIDPRLRGGRRARQDDAPKRKRVRPPRAPRRTAVAMPLLILFALVAAFFSWVSAEPLWLAMGHGKTGTLTVTSCAGSGLLQRCVGEFATPERDFTAVSVDVFGPPGQAEGLSAPARIVGANSHRAYVTNGTGGLHLRWMVGLSIVLLCSIAIVFATGALRLPERRERLAAVGLAFAGPLLVTIGFLAATF